MPGMTLRQVPCSLCGQTFTLLEGDLFIPAPQLCDACLKENWDQADEALITHGWDPELLHLLHHYQQSSDLGKILEERQIARGSS